MEEVLLIFCFRLRLKEISNKIISFKMNRNLLSLKVKYITIVIMLQELFQEIKIKEPLSAHPIHGKT